MDNLLDIFVSCSLVIFTCFYFFLILLAGQNTAQLVTNIQWYYTPKCLIRYKTLNLLHFQKYFGFDNLM